MDQIKKLVIHVTGQVTKVGFRKAVKTLSERLRIGGKVRGEPVSSCRWLERQRSTR